jgi:PAS domain S-box-containing protein
MLRFKKNNLGSSEEESIRVMLRRKTGPGPAGRNLSDENSLHEKEQTYRTIWENSVAGHYIVQDGRFRAVNENAASYAGYTAKELIGRKSDSLVHPDDKPKVREHARDMLLGTRSAPHVFRILTPGGDIHWIMETVTTIMFNGRRAILGNSMDITESMQAEESLRESRSRLAGIIDFLPDPTFVIDLDAKVIAWNRAIEEITGVKARDILGKGDYEYALPFYGARRPMLINQALRPEVRVNLGYQIQKMEKDILIAEIDVLIQNKKRTFLWVKASPLYNSRGRIVGAIETVRDITERKLTEDAMRESERRLADIIDFLPDPTYAIDLEGRLIAWNRAVEEMTGVKSRDILGKGNYEHSLHFYGDRRPMLLDLVLDPPGIRETDYSFFKKQGELLIAERYIPHIRAYLWGKAGPLYDRNNKVVGAIQSLRDITEQKKSEEALRESERRLADIIDFLPDPTFAIDLGGRLIAWNRAMEEMMGVKAKDILGKGNYEHALHFYGERRPMLLDLVLDPGGIREKDYSFFKMQGELLIAERYIPHIRAYLWGKASPLYDRNNKVVGAIQSLRDITEQKKSEEALRESERRLADIIDFLPDPTFAIDLGGRLIAWNRAMEEMMGVKAKDILGKGNYEHSLHFYGERRPMLLDLVLDPASVRETDYSFFKKQGELLIAERFIPHIRAYLWGKASPLYDRNNKVAGAIQSLRDITEQKRAEDVLRESEDRYRTIFENTGNATMIVEEDTTITLANAEFENLYGYRKEEIEGRIKWTEFIVKEDLRRLKKYHYARRMDAAAAPRQYESRMINKAKQIRDILITTELIPGTSRSIVTFLDITERKQSEQALIRREQELNAKTRELEELNAALKILLKRREEDKNELEEKVLTNIKQLVLPYVDKLKKGNAGRKDLTNLNIIESNLKDIVSPFARRLSAKYLNFTPKELQIANLIKEGKTTKEIADYMDISKSAIDTHRYHIRQKLGLINKRANLQSHLSSIL